MTKFWYQLNSFVPQNFWICWSNNHFFCQTQITSSFATFISESTFKSEGLSITMDTNLTETDFLDVSFNLKMDKFSPYRNLNITPIYIYSESNHQPFITKQLPSMTNRHISNLSCNENEFNKAKPLYKSALKNRRFNYSMKFKATFENAKTKQ